MINRVIAAALCCLAVPAVAHEFIVKPAMTEAAAGAAMPITVVSSHVFMTSEELEPAEDLAVWVLNGDKREPVPVAEGGMVQDRHV